MRPKNHQFHYRPSFARLCGLRHFILAPCWFSLFAFGIALGARARAEAPLWGKQVLGIRLQTDAGLTLAEFGGKIVQKPGAPLDPSAVSQTLKNLYATGRFRTLRADVEEEAGGVDLILAGEAQFFTGSVEVREQGKVLSPAALAGGARLALGQPLYREELDRARQRIASLLSSEGYHRAQIAVAVRRDISNQLADVVFSVIAGPPARLGSITFHGRSAIPDSRLVAIAGWKKGIRLTSAKITHGLSEIHNALAKRGYWAATTSVERRTYVSSRNAERLDVKINAGPVVRVHAEGARISSSALKNILPVYQEGLTDDLSLETGALRIEDYFEQRGYFSAKARWRRITHPGAIDVTYAIDLGAQSVFEGYSFTGNRSISAQQLSRFVSLRTPGLTSNTHGVFSETMLNRDVKALVSYYQSQGFLGARVTPHLKRQPGFLSVRFAIHEGPRTRVAKVSIRGAGMGSEEPLLDPLRALPGQPYSPALISQDRETMLNELADGGFGHAVVTAHVSPAGPYRVNVEYQVFPGPRETIARVVVMGNQHTHAALIRRELTFRAGQPLSQAKIYASQRRLYNLGLFKAVRISPENPGGAESAKTILVSVDEADRWTLGYGFGLDVQRLNGNRPAGQLGVSPRLSLDLTRIGVGGRDQTLSLRGRLSDLETGGEANYLIPHFLNHPTWSLHLDALAERTRDVLTFTSMIDQASLSLEKQYTPSTFLIGRYNYRLVSVSNLHINPLQLPLFSQPVRDAGVESTFVRDTRDSPADATRGSYLLLDASLSTMKLGSQANFIRAFAQNSTYHRLAPHLVFARNTQFGVETAYGALRQVTVSGKPVLTNEIPLPERFFAGGSDSIRAFSLNQAGPRDPATGYPIGGEALFVNSLELRVPFRDGRYGLVFFDDAGNVYSDLSVMRLLKFSQPSLTDLNYTVDSPGLGLRYRTPIGPIRLDVSYVPNPPRFAFGKPQEVQQLPRFQYFISIGQSF